LDFDYSSAIPRAIPMLDAQLANSCRSLAVQNMSQIGR
jgi:hypothetical protein